MDFSITVFPNEGVLLFCWVISSNTQGHFWNKSKKQTFWNTTRRKQLFSSISIFFVFFSQNVFCTCQMKLLHIKLQRVQYKWKNVLALLWQSTWNVTHRRGLLARLKKLFLLLCSSCFKTTTCFCCFCQLGGKFWFKGAVTCSDGKYRNFELQMIKKIKAFNLW